MPGDARMVPGDRAMFRRAGFAFQAATKGKRERREKREERDGVRRRSGKVKLRPGLAWTITTGGVRRRRRMSAQESMASSHVHLISMLSRIFDHGEKSLEVKTTTTTIATAAFTTLSQRSRRLCLHSHILPVMALQSHPLRLSRSIHHTLKSSTPYLSRRHASTQAADAAAAPTGLEDLEPGSSLAPSSSSIERAKAFDPLQNAKARKTQLPSSRYYILRGGPPSASNS